jgi:hypothetical protein
MSLPNREVKKYQARMADYGRSSKWHTSMLGPKISTRLRHSQLAKLQKHMLYENDVDLRLSLMYGSKLRTIMLDTSQVVKSDQYVIIDPLDNIIIYSKWGAKLMENTSGYLCVKGDEFTEKVDELWEDDFMGALMPGWV